jgi:peptide/nickel transport system substrate-binding protein
MSSLQNAYTNASFAERCILNFFGVIFVASTLGLLFEVNSVLSTTVPTYGGTLKEGIVGAPRFINPLLASTDADRDMTQLVYAGLLSAKPEGYFKKELAESYTISEDGRIYTFTIQSSAVFHDGVPVTADDVVFTVLKAQDNILKSPKRPNWEGVQVEKIDTLTVQFTLKEPYAPFLENATIGILPKHIWNRTTSEQFAFSQFNLEPIGAGPYTVEKIRRNTAGVPETYELHASKNYVLGKPFISKIIFHFYPNEEKLLGAYKDSTIDAVSALKPSYATELEDTSAPILSHPLPRIFGVFFNQNEATLFTHREVRRALQESVDIEALIDTVLLGYATPTKGPLTPKEGSVEEYSKIDLVTAGEILTDNGWEKNKNGIYEKKGETLSFTLSTANTSELKETALFLKQAWDSFGADVTVELFDIGVLNQEIIRPRNFDALLFGQIIGRTPDPFAFWHSSQRNDPGLNIALYANIAVDTIVEKIRSEENPDTREKLYADFTVEVQKDQPAVFLYAPDFIYVVPKNLSGVELGLITTPAERFLNINTWYMQTENIWNIFTH